MSRARDVIDKELIRLNISRAKTLKYWHHEKAEAAKRLRSIYDHDKAIRDLEAALERISDE